MLKHLMNGGSLLSYALYDAAEDARLAREAQRNELLKNNTITSDPPEKKEGENNDNKSEDGDNEDDEEDDDKEEDKEEEDEDKEKLTPEQIKEKEAADKLAAKAKRKEDRVQKRINDVIAERDAERTKVAELQAKLDANPDARLTEEEVETRATAKANEKLREAEIKKIQTDFDNDCEALRKDAVKIDKDFDDKIVDMAEQFGPIPSFMIGILKDVSNGGEVLVTIASDDDMAEEIWSLRPAKMTLKLLEISNKLIAAKKKPRKEISKVEVITPLNSNNVKEATITDKDTTPEGMPDYVAKRRAQMAEKQKLRGF